MTDQPDTHNTGLLAALWQDLQRPAGGWTMGFVTIIGAVVFGAAASSVHPWLVVVAGALLLLHVMCGAAGYYPARL